jgi:hypothetical protein
VYFALRKKSVLGEGFLREKDLPCRLHDMARSLPVGIIQGARSNKLFRFLHRLIKRLSVNQKHLLFNTLYLLAGFFIASFLNLIIEGRLDATVSGISANYDEAMVAGEPALKVALAPARYVLLLVATDAQHNETRQPAPGPDGEDAKNEIRRVRSRTRLPAHEFWLQGGLAEN